MQRPRWRLSFSSRDMSNRSDRERDQGCGDCLLLGSLSTNADYLHRWQNLSLVPTKNRRASPKDS